MRTTTILALAWAACAGTAAAQGIYRCGSTYSQQPCEGARPVQAAAEGPTAAQQAQARANAQRDARMANDMEKARLKEEARPASAYIPPPTAAAKPQADTPAKGKPGRKNGKAAQPEHFTATAVTPAPKKTKKKQS